MADSESIKETDPKNTPEQPSIQLVSLLSGLFWILLGFVIIYFFQEKPIYEPFTEGLEVWYQLLTGLIFGAIFSFLALQLLHNEKMKAVIESYGIIQQIRELKLTPFQMVTLSLVAGISEEFLFRAAIQPLLGVWLTSIIFIGIHGYIRLSSIPKFLYTMFTFLLSCALGYLYIAFGIYSAMMAHAVYDMIVLWKISGMFTEEN